MPSEFPLSKKLAQFGRYYTDRDDRCPPTVGVTTDYSGIAAVNQLMAGDLWAAAEALDEAEALRQRQTWQPMETAPKDCTAILACHIDNKTGRHGMKVTFRVEPGSEDYVFHAVNSTWRPTHWMPLPDPPKAEERT